MCKAALLLWTLRGLRVVAVAGPRSCSETTRSGVSVKAVQVTCEVRLIGHQSGDSQGRREITITKLEECHGLPTKNRPGLMESTSRQRGHANRHLTPAITNPHIQVVYFPSRLTLFLNEQRTRCDAYL